MHRQGPGFGEWQCPEYTHVMAGRGWALSFRCRYVISVDRKGPCNSSFLNAYALLQAQRLGAGI